ncbi:MAG: helix-turn-helix domain-containing protein, partial [Acinetobacter sp.]|nr:helix-turn-helix domain-containing protein [Acinetobacter sp.]
MRAHSLELRKKVMAAYRQTKHKSNVCKQFNIARSTLDEWISLEKNTKDLKPLPAT